MTRWRLVSEQGGNPPQVSTVVLAPDEVEEQLDGEAMLHEMAGWKVTRGDRVVVCRKVVGPRRGLVRIIRAVEFDAMHDPTTTAPEGSWTRWQ